MIKELKTKYKFTQTELAEKVIQSTYIFLKNTPELVKYLEEPPEMTLEDMLMNELNNK